MRNSKSRAPINISVFEYGLISASEKAAPHNVQIISQQAFNHLKSYCLRDDSTSRLLNLKIAYGAEVLQVQNYAGVIICPDGTQIEILPKIAKNDASLGAAEAARLSLLMMLRQLRQFRHIETDAANIKKYKAPLLEVFLSQFLNSVNNLLKKGIKSDYVKEQSNNPFLKGKLLHSQQIKKNHVCKHKFFVEFDSYLIDTPANRVIHSTLKKISTFSLSNENRKLLQEFLFAFEDVPLSKDYKRDIASIALGRGAHHYKTPIHWAELILEGFSPLTMHGNNHAHSLLFPMEAVFENFVAKYLATKVVHPQSLSAQVKGKSLVTFGERSYFRLKPDIFLRNHDSTNVIMDTKWKLIDQSKISGTDKFGLSQNDFYQMLAYGHKYLNGTGELVLVYPKTSSFDKPLEHTFNYDDRGNLKLKVVPFDINHQCTDRIDLSYIGLHNTLLKYERILSANIVITADLANPSQ